MGCGVLLLLIAPTLVLAEQPAALPDAATADRLVTFANTGPAVQLTVEGVGSVKMARGARIGVATTAANLRYTVLKGDDWQYSGTIDLAGTVERLITLVAPRAHLRIVNRSDEAAEIRMYGERIGLLPRAGSKTFGPLPAGVATMVAIGTRSRGWSLLRMELRSGVTHTAILPPTPAGLVVQNVLTEQARVSVDHRDYGRVDAGATIHLLGLVPGSHDVALHGLDTGRVWRNDTQVGAEGARSADAGQLSLLVFNDTGETLALPAALGGLYDRPLAPGDRVTFAMQRKEVRVILEGEDSQLRYVRDVTADPARQSWTVTRPTGQLRLTNGTGEAAKVAVDGLATVALARNQTIQLRRVPAGRLQLQVTTERTGQVFTRGVFLEPGGDISWLVSAGGTSLVIANDWPEPVSLTIDGAPRGLIAAKAIFRIPRIRPGQHRVGMRTMVTGRSEVSIAEVVDGKRTRLLLQPPDGTLRVKNVGEQALDVLARGRLLGRVQAGQQRAFSVKPGQLVAEVRQVGSGRNVSWAGALAPAQHVILPTPSTTGGALIIHNHLDAAVYVTIDAGAPAEIGPGKTVKIRALTSGEHLVQVSGPKFVQRQRVVVDAALPAVRIELAAKMFGAPVADKSAAPK